MKIGLTYNLKSDWVLSEHDPLDANAEFDNPNTIDDLAGILESFGHQVVKLGHVRAMMADMSALKSMDIVFNIHEGFGDRNRESQVPILLDLLKIPYTGSDALTLGITLDKVIAKKCFIADGVSTPKYFVVNSPKDLDQIDFGPYPLIVKTSCEGTSKGLTESSRVCDLGALRQEALKILNVYKQPALVEQFIRGTEYTVAVIGNENPQAMPIAQVVINGKADLADEFYTYDLTQSSNVRYLCPAPIDSDLARRIQQMAVLAYRSVGCRDYGRVDFRVDEFGQPYVLEINPLPSLDRKDVFNLFPKVLGTTFEEIIRLILNLAMKRCGLSAPDSGQIPQAFLSAAR